MRIDQIVHRCILNQDMAVFTRKNPGHIRGKIANLPAVLVTFG